MLPVLLKSANVKPKKCRSPQGLKKELLVFGLVSHLNLQSILSFLVWKLQLWMPIHPMKVMIMAMNIQGIIMTLPLPGVRIQPTMFAISIFSLFLKIYEIFFLRLMTSFFCDKYFGYLIILI